ncbi:helix-turn-helix transcriptional regulator [Paeniglutamicibacter gangotriensis]|uniref:Helix-turn-helix transcriptional regulator n=2 Tax=Paeniglutamicibacter gangotriensis TaxID=254787 RepID=A0A5B0EEF0_9MICC|nr:helix-turn-helix transcriptional regulator [Paeniglutamicibacter gangotriensis]
MISPMLKAMANPLRRRIAAELAAVESARATDLADRLGVAANSLSFHLRVLAEAGIIEEAPELARDRRDRVWRALPGGLSVGSPSLPSSTEDSLALQAYLGQEAEDQIRQLQAVVNWGTSYATGEDVESRGMLDIASMRLSVAEAEDLEAGVLDLLRRIKERSLADAGDGAERKLWNFSMVMAREDLPGLR